MAKRNGDWYQQAYKLWPLDTEEHQKLRGAFYEGGKFYGFPKAEFDAIKLGHLKKGDVVVLTFKGFISDNVVDRIKQYVKPHLDSGVKVLVLGDSARVEVKKSPKKMTSPAR